MKELSEPSGVFSLSVPADWTGQAGQGSAVAVAPNMKASIMVVVSPKGVPTQQFVAGIVENQKQTVPGWTLLAQDMAQVGGRQAAHIRAEGQPNNVPTAGDYYVIETDQAIILFMLFAAKDSLAQYQGALAQVQASFRVGGGAQPAPFPQPQPPQPTPFPQPQPPQPAPFPEPQPPQPAPFPQPMPPPGPAAMKQVTDQGGAFSVAVPGDWVVQQQPGTAGCMEPTGRCNLAIMATQKMVQSADQLAQAAVAMARQNMQGWQQVGTQQIQVAGRQGVLVRATAQVNNNPVVVDYIFVVTDARQFMIVFMYMAQEAQQRQTTVQQILQSLRIQ